MLTCYASQLGINAFCPRFDIDELDEWRCMCIMESIFPKPRISSPMERQIYLFLLTPSCLFIPFILSIYVKPKEKFRASATQLKLAICEALPSNV